MAILTFLQRLEVKSMLGSWQTSPWTEQYFSLFRDVISFAGNAVSQQSTGVYTDTPTAHHIFSCRVVALLFRGLVVRVYSHTLTSMHLHGSRLKRIFVALQSLTPRRSTPSSPFPNQSSDFLNNPAKIHGLATAAWRSAEPAPLAGDEPNQIVDGQNYRHVT